MSKKCGYCVYMDLSEEDHGKYRCERDGVWRFATSADASDCYKYCERFRRDMDKAEAAIANSKKYQEANSGYTALGLCYITTVVVNILGLPDDAELLMTLRKFRLEVLQNDPKYRDILFRYDALGPVIAKAISMNSAKESIAQDLYNLYLVVVERYINDGLYDEAIEEYQRMTNKLLDTFVTSYAIGEVAEKEYDQKSGGHGALKFKKN